MFKRFLAGVLGAIAAAGYGIYRAARRTGECSICKTGFRPINGNKSACAMCKIAICSDCHAEGPKHPAIPASLFAPFSPLCPTCLQKKTTEGEKFQNAIINVNTVAVFPRTTTAKITTDLTVPTLKVESDWCKSREDAVKQIKVVSAFQGFDVIVDQIFKEDQRTDGNHTYNVWQATGICEHALKT